MPPRQLLQPAPKMRTHRQRVRLQSLRLENVQHRQPGHASDRAAPGRREEVPGVAVRRSDRAGGDDRAQRVAVAHGLGHRDHVRHHALLLEPPEPAAEAAVPDLDLVRDGQPAVPPDLGVDRGQVAVGQRHPARVPVIRLGQERPRRPPRGRQRPDQGNRVHGIPRSRSTAVTTPVGIRRVHHVDPPGPGLQRARVVRGRGRHRVGRVRPAVVGLPHRHHVRPPGRDERQPQRQIDRLRARVDQENGVQRRRQQPGQPLGELGHRGVVEPRVRVQPPQLPRHRRFQPRVRVPEHAHVVDHVQVHPPVGPGQVLPPPPLDPRRRRVIMLLHVGQRRRPPRQQIPLGAHRTRIRQPEQR